MNETQSAPIILVHGLFGFNQLTFGGLKVAEYFRSIPEALRRDGHRVPDPPRRNPGGSFAIQRPRLIPSRYAKLGLI